MYPPIDILNKETLSINANLVLQTCRQLFLSAELLVTFIIWVFLLFRLVQRKRDERSKELGEKN
jgi:hypothetical protein